MGCEDAAGTAAATAAAATAEAGRGAERSHEQRDVSCVRLEREVIGVRLWQNGENMGGCLEEAGRGAERSQ